MFNKHVQSWKKSLFNNVQCLYNTLTKILIFLLTFEKWYNHLSVELKWKLRRKSFYSGVDVKFFLFFILPWTVFVLLLHRLVDVCFEGMLNIIKHFFFQCRISLFKCELYDIGFILPQRLKVIIWISNLPTLGESSERI